MWTVSNTMLAVRLQKKGRYSWYRRSRTDAKNFGNKGNKELYENEFSHSKIASLWPRMCLVRPDIVKVIILLWSLLFLYLSGFYQKFIRMFKYIVEESFIKLYNFGINRIWILVIIINLKFYLWFCRGIIEKVDLAEIIPSYNVFMIAGSTACIYICTISTLWPNSLFHQIETNEKDQNLRVWKQIYYSCMLTSGILWKLLIINITIILIDFLFIFKIIGR